jgi:tripartite-type tricarboxylate transporter receptor subunit TctC
MSMFRNVRPTLALACILLAVLFNQSRADEYPSKPIKIIVPLSVGAPGDVRTRDLAALLTQQLGKPVIVENKPGAGGAIATTLVAHAAPDGYTILYTFNGPMTIVPHVIKAPGYDPIKDFAPIIRVGSQAMILVVPASSPHANVRALLAAAKAKPGELTYGSAGIGGVGHLPAEMLLRAAGGLQMVLVPYKGDNEVVNELVNARLHMAFATPTAALPQIQAGKLRALAVTSRARFSALPDTPTMSEAGFNDFVWINWPGFVAPARTPPAIVDRLYKEIAVALSNPGFKARQEAQFVQLAADKPEVFAQLIKREHERIGKLVREIGLQPQ